MFRRVAYLAASAGLALLVGGCALNFLGGERRESWRDQEERACLRRDAVVENAFIQRVKEINGRGACGIDRPLKVSAFVGGRVGIGPQATLGCPMTAALEQWLQNSVQPAAIAWFGMPVVELKQMGTYSCRTRNNVHGARLSEHAFGNALDIGAFKLADGRSIAIKRDFLRGPPEAQGFLREVYAGACAQFKTVLGPGAKYHGDHFHLDLAHHNASGTSRYCKPTPTWTPTVRPPYGGDRMANYPASPDQDDQAGLLSRAPPDVAADLSDPFGVAAVEESAPPAEEGEANSVGTEPYPADVGADPSYSPSPPETAVAAASPAPRSQSAPASSRHRQGFFSWLFKPAPPENIPLSYAP